MSQSILRELFQDVLKGQAFPCLINIKDRRENILSATALWNMSLHRRHEMRKAGMKHGDLWVQSEGGSEALVNFFACLNGGYIFCIKNPPQLSSGKLQSVMSWTSTLSMGVSSIGPKDIPLGLPNRDGFALLLQTSGTSSGVPRLVRLAGEQIAYQLEIHFQAMKILPETNRLLVLPWFHSFGFILDALLGLYSRQYLFTMQNAFLHPRGILDAIEEYDIEWLATVPRILMILQQYSESSPHLRSLLKRLNIHSGGAYLASDLRAEISGSFKEFYWGYGLTECGPGVLLNGSPLGCQVKLRHRKDSDFQDLLVKSPSTGIWSEQGKDMSEGWFVTGDMAKEMGPGLYDVIGRREDCIKSISGNWINLRELEQSLQNEYGAAGIRIQFSDKLSCFEVKVLAKGQDIGTDSLELGSKIKAKLEKILPLPVELLLGAFSTETLGMLTQYPKKSLSEAVDILPSQLFTKVSAA